ncbi:AfsR/SARP family transcriptional regulator [Nesterenkonia halobia]|uniref:BTAD domain-containing putative transcriptional regulator n=1 Tax=Nesterenkonia halobia TaxID=37922 RepID=A0ABP6REQ4_9MICC
MDLRIGLLGPLQVELDGADVAPSSDRLRSLLAVLALAPGRSVSVGRLASQVWGSSPPSSPKGAVATYVGRLRRHLGDGAIVTEPHGYALRIAVDAVDASRLERLVADARRARVRGEASEEERLLREATALWRGVPLADVDLPEVASQEVVRLEEKHLAASERLADLDISAGRFDSTIDRLTGLTASWPLRESLWTRLLRVLHLVGRRAEALDRYEHARSLIAEQLGSDPGAELQAAHAELLAAAAPPAAERGEGQAMSGLASTPPPHQLPRDILQFIGREEELELLDACADRGGPVVITGPPGVGKSALAVHWSHRHAEQFPDGQIHLDLRGFDLDEQVMTCETALRTLIAAFAPGEDLPSAEEALAARWRTLTTGQELLIVLDNARDSDQVRMLMPAESRCMILVTSRSSMNGLLAAGYATALPLEPVGPRDAARLLAARIGCSRVDREPEAAERLILGCSGLPLAVALAAARIAGQPQLPLESLLEEADAVPGALDIFSGDVEGADLRTVFSWSWRALSPAAARCFRLLGLHPGSDISLTAAASLVGRPVGEFRALLGELACAHLVREHSAGRYVMHDLLRAYAAELAATTAAEEREEAVLRLVDHFLHTGRRGTVHLRGSEDVLLAVPEARPGSVETALTGRQDTLAWFRKEWGVVVQLIETTAAEPLFESRCPGLVQSLSAYLELDRHWGPWEHVAAIGLAATARIGDDVGEADLRVSAAGAAMYQERTDEALEHLHARRRILERRGDEEDLARVTYQLGLVLAHHGDLPQALEMTLDAAARCRRAGNAITEAMAYSNAAEMLMNLERHDEALEMCEVARTAWGESRSHNTVALWMTEGRLRLLRGEPELALQPLARAVEAHRADGFEASTVRALTIRGEARRRTGDHAGAAADWHEALEAVDDPSDEAAVELRGRLADIGGGTGSGTGVGLRHPLAEGRSTSSEH